MLKQSPRLSKKHARSHIDNYHQSVFLTPIWKWFQMRLESKQKQQSVRVKQVAFLFNQARTETIGGVLSAAVVAAWYWKTVEASPIIGWTGSVLVVYLVRLLLTQI